MFAHWAHEHEDMLAASLLQWSPEDLPFREIAYAALCLAAGGRNIDVIPSEKVGTNGVFGYINEGQKDNSDSFFSLLAAGAHLQGSPPGSSPEGNIYWLDNVLVLLTAQLYRPGAAEHGIARVIHYCNTKHPEENVDAVLISVEHVILVHITPDRKVQHSAVMPLFNIPNHVTMSASDRYAPSYLKKLAGNDEDMMVKEAKETMKKNEGGESVNEDDSNKEEKSALFATRVEGCVYSTFYALVHLFEAAACKLMPLIKTADGCFPNEIYMQIVTHVTDKKTRQSLMKVSRMFRRLCQEDLLLAKDLIVESCDTLSRDKAGPWFQKYDVATEIQSHVRLQNAGYSRNREAGLWEVVIGTEDGRKSLLDGLMFRFAEI